MAVGILEMLGSEGEMMFGVLLVAAAATAQPQLDCNNPITQADINVCASRDAKAADAAMVTEYQIATVILGNMDREIDRKYDKRPSFSAALLSSQRAWLAFRKAQCEVEGYAARGGSIENMIVDECIAAVSEQRTKQIRDMLKSYSGE
jgi:uncharacterized protein YecT (DUF1311 family)